MSRMLPERPDVLAPDGSDVRILASASKGSMAHFSLRPGAVSVAVRHRTVEEIWFILQGQGRMWMKYGEGEEELLLRPGLSFALPVGTSFQFRNDGSQALQAVAVTMPPWPGEAEAEKVSGRWTPSV